MGKCWDIFLWKATWFGELKVLLFNALVLGNRDKAEFLVIINKKEVR